MTTVSNQDPMVYQCQALTDLWTGDARGQPNRLVTTGLLGSIRWWGEVLVRGLGGRACDPNDTKCQDRDHCVVCELFGCTGWARKFRFEVLNEDGQSQTAQIKRNTKFSLRFTPLRPIRDEEWALLEAALRLIADYGAIGGKTVFKPTDESSRAREIHHQDYGIVEIVRVDPPITSPNVTEVKKYICEGRWRKPEPKTKEADFSWASLKHFWFADGKTLSRDNTSSSSFNKVLGRKWSKVCRDCGQVHNPPIKCSKTKRHPRRESEQLVDPNDEVSRWLAGSQQESKKVFSFKNPARTFGFVKPGLIDYDEMKSRLRKTWGESGWEFLTKDEIIKRLFAQTEDRS